MRKIYLVIISCIITLLASCSSTESEFIDALNDDASLRHLCLSRNKINVSQWELDNEKYLAQAPGGLFGNEGTFEALPVLIEKGYISSELTEINARQRVSGYKLTDKGNKYFAEKKVCIGTRTASEVLEYTEPAATQGITITRVKYSYDFDLNELGDDLNIEQSLLSEMFNGKLSGEGASVFIETSKGWKLQNGW